MFNHRLQKTFQVGFRSLLFWAAMAQTLWAREITTAPAEPAHCGVVDLISMVEDPRYDDYSLKNLNPLGRFLRAEFYQNPNGKRNMPTSYVEIPVAKFPENRVNIEVADSTYFDLVRRFRSGDKVIVPFHPNRILHGNARYLRNQDEDVFIDGFLSASRSIFILIGGKLFSLKMPVQYLPWDLKIQQQVKKLETKIEMQSMQFLFDHIRSTDKLLVADRRLELLLDIMTLAPENDQNGVILRELDPLFAGLEEGEYVLPAFANFDLPVRQFLQTTLGIKPGQYHDYLQEFYPKKIGRTIALALLRYGILLQFVHGQNTLTRLNTVKNIGIGDKFFVRDINDSRYVAGYAEARKNFKFVGFPAEKTFENLIQSVIYPYMVGARTAFEESSRLKEWNKLIDHGFKDSIYNELHRASKDALTSGALRKLDVIYEEKDAVALLNFLSTADGVLLWRNFLEFNTKR